MKIALDATYSVGEELSGVGIYSREILAGLAAAHPDVAFRFFYRAHRFLRSFRGDLPPNASRRILEERWLRPRAALYHGLNQRLPQIPLPRTVCTFHDLFVLTGDYSTADFRARFARQARDAAARSDHIIAVSRFTADQVTQLLAVEQGRVSVVHHGVRALTLPEVPREDIVLHVGAIQKRKNLVRLVRAFERLPDRWRLVMAGSCGFGAEEVLTCIRETPARARITVTGYVSAKSLGEWYARARIFAFPSLDEGFGMPVLEAMAAGLPVLASNRSALPEVAGGAALLADPEDTEAIAENLLRLAEDEVFRRELSLRGRAHALNFTWEKAATETWQVYAHLLR